MRASWLHVSDFHIRAGDPYDRDVVLRALVSSVRKFRDRGRTVELIFATGDVAHSGRPEEYELASSFLDALLDAARLERRHLFVIPGNHDVDRDSGVGLLRALESREQADAYFGRKGAKPHLAHKQNAFIEWHNRYFKGLREMSLQSTCGPVEAVDLPGGRVAVLCLNTALFCQDDHDHAKLCVGRRCVDEALQAIETMQPDLTVALHHHPLDWLSDIERANIKGALSARVDVALRGHLHETDVENVVSVTGNTLHIAAGATYQTRKWPNRALYATTNDDRGVTLFPIRYEDAPRELWTVDPSLFPDDPGYERTFALRSAPARGGAIPVSASAEATAARPARFRSNISSRRNLPFVGRTNELTDLHGLLADKSMERVVVVHGPPGVGKSELAREFARTHRELYPGGTFLIDASIGPVLLDLIKVGVNILHLQFPDGVSLQDQCEQTLLSLGDSPVLLIYDNAYSQESIEPWLPRAGMRCHVIVTTVSDRWGPGWSRVPVRPLSVTTSVELIEKLAGRPIAVRFGEELATLAEGLPMQICPAAVTLAYEERRGRLAAARVTITREAEESFDLVYKRLERPVRLLLLTAAFLNPVSIDRDELYSQCEAATTWSRADFDRLVDACRDLHLLYGDEQLRLHQLFARFLLSSSLPPRFSEDLDRIRVAQRKRLLALSENVLAKPAESRLAAAIAQFPLNPAAWDEAGVEFAAKELELVGDALLRVGKFIDATVWYERAATVKESARPPIDHENLSSSLHCAAFCYKECGQFEKALLLAERAVAAAEKGNEEGKVDFDSVGKSLDLSGKCLASLGKYDEARARFERAVNEKQRGDIQGRVDHQSVSVSLHQVGICLSSRAKFGEALEWYERAVNEGEKGDIHGQVDDESVGRSLHEVGRCLSGMGNYDKAKSYYEKALVLALKGDIHGSVDQLVIGTVQHQIGDCLRRLGKPHEAREWFERAIISKQLGDIFGRVDNDSVSRSLCELGVSLFELNELGQAKAVFTRAAQAAERGDLHGRINHASVSGVFLGIAQCLKRSTDAEQAMEWYHRAIEAGVKGDLHGHIDSSRVVEILSEGADCLRLLGRTQQSARWVEAASRPTSVKPADLE